MRAFYFLIILWAISCCAQEIFSSPPTGFLLAHYKANDVPSRHSECADRLHAIVKSTDRQKSYELDEQRRRIPQPRLASLSLSEQYRTLINQAYAIDQSAPQEVLNIVQELVDVNAYINDPCATVDFLITRADGSQPIRTTFFNEQGIIKGFSRANKNIAQHPEACRAFMYCDALFADSQGIIHEKSRTALIAINEYLSSDELPGPPGSYASVLYDLLRTCHPELETSLQHECDEVAITFLNYDEPDNGYNNLSAAREQAAKVYHEEHGAKQQCFVQLHATSRALLREHNYDYRKFTFINGNALQRQLLDETGQLINQIASYSELYNEPIAHLLVDMADVAAECNHAGSIKKGYECANVGWYILDIMQAVGLGIVEGLIDGVRLTATYIKQHPIEFALSAMFTKPMLAYHLAKLVIRSASVAFDLLSTIDYENVTFDDVLTSIDNAKQTCYTGYQTLRKMPLKTLVAGGVAFATDCYLQGKCAKGVSAFYEKTQEILLKHAQKFDWKAYFNDHLRPGFINVFPRGKQPVKNPQENFAQTSNKNSLEAPKNILKVHTMKEFFENTLFGQELKNKVIKTNYFYKNQPIYKLQQKVQSHTISKGDYFYLDNLHFDHIEVFDQSGSMKSVLNFDGTINIEKTKKAYGRTIKL